MQITNVFSYPEMSSPKSSQAGAALIIGLVILTMLTMVALNAAKTTIFQEKMVYNTQERNKALQAAESASRYAWSILGTTNYTESDFITNATKSGLYDLRGYDPITGSKLTANWNAIYSVNNWPWSDTAKRAEMPNTIATNGLSFIPVNINPMQLAAIPQFVAGMHAPVLRKGSENKYCVPFTIAGAGQGSVDSSQVVIELKVIPKFSCYPGVVK